MFPEAFGLMSYCVTVVIGLQLFSDLGIRVALIQHQNGDDRDFQDTAWTIGLIRGFVLSTGSALAAWPAAYWRGEPAPELIWLMPFFGLTSIIDSLASTKPIMLQRRMQHQRVIVIDFMANLIATTTMIVAVWQTRSVYALALAPVTSSSIRAVISHFIAPGRSNRLRWHKPSAKAIGQFSSWTLLGTICNFLAGQTDKLVIGIKSLAQLGVYHFASQLAQIPIALMTTLSSKVLFPYYSRAVREGTLKRDYKLPHSVKNWLTLLFSVGLAIAGPTLILLIYDERYQEAGWIVRLLVIGAWLQILEAHASALLLANGTMSNLVWSNLAKLAILAIGIPLGTWADGLRGMIIAGVIGDLARYLVTQRQAWKRDFHLIDVDFKWTLWAILAATFGYFSGWAVDELIHLDDHWPKWAYLLVRLLWEVVAITIVWYLIGKKMSMIQLIKQLRQK
jgi:O-antigen/teichoic acid export membrane protein